MQEAVTSKEVQLTSCNVTEDTTSNANKDKTDSGNAECNSSDNVEATVSFCTHVGWNGVLVMCFSLVMASLFIYLLYPYTASFRNFDRDYILVFIGQDM